MPGCLSAEQATLASLAGLRLLSISAFVTYASLLCSPTHPLPFLCNLPTSSTFFTMWYPVCFPLLGLIILLAPDLQFAVLPHPLFIIALSRFPKL